MTSPVTKVARIQFLSCKLAVEAKTVKFFPPAKSWLVNSNFIHASRMQGWEDVMVGDTPSVGWRLSKTGYPYMRRRYEKGVLGGYPSRWQEKTYGMTTVQWYTSRTQWWISVAKQKSRSANAYLGSYALIYSFRMECSSQIFVQKGRTWAIPCYRYYIQRANFGTKTLSYILLLRRLERVFRCKRAQSTPRCMRQMNESK